MEVFTLRLCRRSDLPTVAAIEAACFGGADGRGLCIPLGCLVQYFDAFSAAFVVAESAGALVGFAVAGVVALDPTQAWLLDVAVLPHLQKSGIGRTMGDWLLNRLSAGGVRTLRATVGPGNQPSRALLGRLGFTVESDVPDYFGPNEPRLVVSRTIA